MNPYHWTWSWDYTIIAVVLLLALFLLLGALLLLRRGGKRQRPRSSRYLETPESVSTPYGYYWTEETQKLVVPGIERARNRDTYYVRGRE